VIAPSHAYLPPTRLAAAGPEGGAGRAEPSGATDGVDVPRRTTVTSFVRYFSFILEIVVGQKVLFAGSSLVFSDGTADGMSHRCIRLDSNLTDAATLCTQGIVDPRTAALMAQYQTAVTPAREMRGNQ
jgi:hypothetical protein